MTGDQVLDLLQGGDLQPLGLLPNASNATLLARVGADGAEVMAVYKPRRGEAPLWDFPRGTLCLRERAAWVIDRVLGWSLVPPTVLRDGPAGFGAVQLFVEEDPQADFRRLPRTHPDALRRLAIFDLVINNADRKAGHCIVDVTGKLWGVDHGVSFHAQPKLRTVIWCYVGEPFPPQAVADLEALAARLADRSSEAVAELGELLAEKELEALRRRVAALVARPIYPEPGPGRHVPWPPW